MHQKYISLKKREIFCKKFPIFKIIKIFCFLLRAIFLSLFFYLYSFFHKKSKFDCISYPISNFFIKCINREVFNLIYLIYNDIKIEKETFKVLKELSNKSPLIIIPSHKSHLDYLTLFAIFNKFKLATTYTIAGDNLNIALIGKLLKLGGAFFIKRSYRTDVEYKNKIKNHIDFIINKKKNFEFFIEGTRERLGKISYPKFGIMKNVLDSKYLDSALFVPISINYDYVLDEKTYHIEHKGNAKDKENLFNLLKTIGSLFKNYGDIYIKFGKIQKYKKNLSLKKFTFNNVQQISKHFPITKRNLISLIAFNLILTKKEKTNRNFDVLIDNIQTYFYKSNYSISNDIINLGKRKILDKFIKEIFIHISMYKNDPCYIFSLYYYSNGLIHSFIPIISQYFTSIQNILYLEYFYPPEIIDNLVEIKEKIKNDEFVYIYNFIKSFFIPILLIYYHIIGILISSTYMKNISKISEIGHIAKELKLRVDVSQTINKHYNLKILNSLLLQKNIFSVIIQNNEIISQKQQEIIRNIIFKIDPSIKL